MILYVLESHFLSLLDSYDGSDAQSSYLVSVCFAEQIGLSDYAV